MDQNPNAQQQQQQQQQQEQQPVVVVVEPDNPTPPAPPLPPPPGSTAGDAGGGPPPAQMVVNSNNSSNELPLPPPPTPAAAVLNTASADVQGNGPPPTPSMFSNSSNEMPQQITIANGGSSDGPSLELLGVSEQFTTSSSITTSSTSGSSSSSAAASWLDFFAQNSTTNSELSNNMTTTTTTLLNVDNGGNSSWTTPTTLSEKINDYENYDKMEGSADEWATAANEHSWSDNKQNFAKAWSGFFLGAAFANVLILFVLLIITRGKRGYFGARLYTLNLAVFAVVQILILAWAQPDDCFGIAKIASISVHNFFIKYNSQLLEWSQIVFLSCTTVLVLDCIHRYRGNGIGIGKLSWILAVLILDVIPMAYIFVKGALFESVHFRAKPLAIYHAVVLVVFTVCATLLKLIVCCVPIYRMCHARAAEEAAAAVVAADRVRAHARRETNRLTAASSMAPAPPKPFTLAKLAFLMTFLVLTSWAQYAVFSLATDLLHPGGLGQATEGAKMDKHLAVYKLLKFINKEHLIYTVKSIQQWAVLIRPFLETLSLAKCQRQQQQLEQSLRRQHGPPPPPLQQQQ
uniref:Uncharacterized protein n=1 Tax=Globodera rostochiensis TaxID=31243 RepID=A0A914I8U1_GLORO